MYEGDDRGDGQDWYQHEADKDEHEKVGDEPPYAEEHDPSHLVPERLQPTSIYQTVSLDNLVNRGLPLQETQGYGTEEINNCPVALPKNPYPPRKGSECIYLCTVTFVILALPSVEYHHPRVGFQHQYSHPPDAT
jgi:hypothetical protein